MAELIDHTPIYLESIRIRLDAIRDSQNRSRYAFLASIIISLAILIAAWNAYFSWYKYFAINNVSFPKSAVTRRVQEKLLDDWVASDRVTVPLLGINFGVSDAPLLGSIALYITSLWFLFCARRENHLIANTVFEADDRYGAYLKHYIFHGIASYLIFTTLTKGDLAVYNLDQKREFRKEEHPIPYLRPSLCVLLYLPAIASISILVVDFTSLFMPAAMRWPHDRLILMLLNHPSVGELIYLAVTYLIGIVLSVMTCFVCSTIYRFQTSTGKLLVAFYNCDRTETPAAD